MNEHSVDVKGELIDEGINLVNRIVHQSEFRAFNRPNINLRTASVSRFCNIVESILNQLITEPFNAYEKLGLLSSISQCCRNWLQKRELITFELFSCYH